MLKSGGKFSRPIKIGIFILIVACVGVLIARAVSSKSKSISDEEVLRRVKMHFAIDDQEQTEVFEVTDITSEEKESQTVFTDVDQGDYGINLRDRKLVIFYDPIEDKIIRVDPIVNQEDLGDKSE
ncbi:hypothetical protein KC853_02805 [Candidatus Saccharibacteria bacterium]|nr:hypothetical protein [Candidatus Saccharibacteria bacterium]MCB9834600.1 hypothetical protein [Candidatus Nomurabacteria bacterium]